VEGTVSRLHNFSLKVQCREVVCASNVWAPAALNTRRAAVGFVLRNHTLQDTKTIYLEQAAVEAPGCAKLLSDP